MSDTYQYRPFGILRFILAMMVMLQHFSVDVAPEYIRTAVFPYSPGNVAVLCFFILSGFIISDAYHHNYQGRPVDYFKNRFLRIVPAYWAALLVSVLVHAWILQHYNQLTSLDRHSIEWEHFQIHNLWKNFLYIIPPVTVNVTDVEYPFIPYAWALQTEMMFYLTVFIVGMSYPILNRFIKAPMGFWLAMAAYAGIAAACLYESGYLPKQLQYGSYFAFGGALFYAVKGYRMAFAVLIPAFLQIIWHFSHYDSGTFSMIPPSRAGQFAQLLIIMAATVYLARLHVRRHRGDKWFGDLSYPLYLNHYLIGVLALNLLPVTTGNFFLQLALSIPFAWIMFHAVEKPLLKIRTKIRHRVIE